MPDDLEPAPSGLSREYLGGVFAGLVIGAAAGVIVASYLNRKPPCPCEAEELVELVDRAPAGYAPDPVPAAAAVAEDELTPQQKAARTRAAKRAGALPAPTAETGPASPEGPIFPNVGGAPAATAGPFAAANGHH